MGLIVKYYCVNIDDNLVFYTPSGEFTITTYTSQINNILINCNGSKSYNQIIEKCVGFEDIAQQLLNFLIEKNIVIDIKNWIKSDYQLTSYPDLAPSTDFNHDNKYQLNIKVQSEDSVTITNNSNGLLNTLISNRKSTRDFINQAVPLNKLATILESMSKYTTPSTGGFYPYNIILCNHIDTFELPQGWYRLDDKNKKLLRLDIDYEFDHCVRIHDDPYILENSTCSIYLVTQLESHCNKYTNRGLKFVFSEGGALIQNAYLTAAQEDVGISALGGFDEKFLIEYLNLDSIWVIPFSLVVGSINNEKNYTSSLQELNDKVFSLTTILHDNGYLKNTQEYTWNKDISNNPLISTTSQFITNDMRSDSGFGTSNTRQLSKLKSLVEVYERIVSTEPCFDTQTTAIELPNYVNPNIVLPRNKEYVEKYNLYKFSSKDENLWLTGFDYHENEKNYSLIDTLYYPAYHDYLNREPYIYGNSSGTCGHYDRNLAKQGAFYELLERDALMVMWYSKKVVLELEHSSLPGIIASQIKNYAKHGVVVKILDISIDIPTYLTIFLNEQHQPHFTSGASSNLSSCNALKKSFDEAEFNYLSWYKLGDFIESESNDISEPFHHHLFYCNKTNWSYISWLLNTKKRKYIAYKQNFEALLSKFNPWFFHLRNPMIPELYIYKCLCDNLAPIHFGFPAQFDISNRLESLGLTLDVTNLNTPHFFS